MAASATQLALPSGERQPDSSLAVYGVLVLGVSVVMVLGGLLGAWLALRSGTRVWPPKGVVVENYYGTTLSVTMLMVALAGWWALYAVRRNELRQATTALGLTMALELAFVNLVTYVVRGAKFGPGTHAYGTVFYAWNVTVIAVTLTGIVVAGTALIRGLGGQVGPREPQLGWAAAWYGTMVSISWFVMYVAVYVIK